MCESLQGVIALLFDESSSFSAPAAFGTYRVLHQVGSGVLGPVFRTCDPRHADLVAVKAFKLDLRPEQVVRVADALRRLVAGRPEHPAAAALVDAGLEGTTPFLATEYLVGDTLDVVLRRSAPLTLGRALPLLTPIAAAIDAGWAVGAGHGTLHPRDVFVGQGAHGVKLTGLGVAQAIESAELAVPIRRPYAAPERARGPWDIRADVYSLAVIAHELLTGRRPAGAAEQDGVFAPEVSPEQRVAIRRVLSAALAERPQDRCPTAGAFVAALAALEASVSAGRPGRPLEIEAAANELSLAGEPDREATPPILVLEEVPHGVPDETPHVVPPGEIDEIDEIDQPGASLFLDAPQGHVSDRLPDSAADVSLDDFSFRQDHRVRPTEEFLSGDVPPAFLAGGHDPVPRSASRWRTVALVGLLVGAGYMAGTYRSGGGSASTNLTDRTASVAEAETRPVAPLPPADSDPVEAAALPAVDVPSAVPPDAVPAAAPAPQPRGALAIRSQPSGAMVTLDGRLMGETPLVVRDLPVGPYTLQVARPGYAPRSQRVTVLAGATERTLTFALEAGITSPSTEFGAIDVDSTPRGARVIVDGRFIGQAPLRVPEVRPGAHTVTLELANHSSVTRQTVVEPGKIAKLIVAMQ